MGLFSRHKKQAADACCTIDNTLFDENLDELNKAREQYKQTKNPLPAIDAYERCLPNVGNAVTHHLFLVELYVKNGQNDKAWGYLNKMLLDFPNAESRIRESQYKLLKHEKRWLDALGMLLYFHIAKPTFNPDAFIKNAMPLAEKLNLADTDIKVLASTAQSNAHDTLSANKVFTDFCQLHGLS